MNDAVFHTGIDAEPNGMFDNDSANEETKELISEQERKLKELSPQLESLVAEIDAEIARLDKISDIPNAIQATSIPDLNIAAEMAARSRQIQFLQNWKMTFSTAMEDLKK